MISSTMSHLIENTNIIEDNYKFNQMMIFHHLNGTIRNWCHESRELFIEIPHDNFPLEQITSTIRLHCYLQKKGNGNWIITRTQNDGYNDQICIHHTNLSLYNLV